MSKTIAFLSGALVALLFVDAIESLEQDTAPIRATIPELIQQKDVPALADRTLSVIAVRYGDLDLTYALVLENGYTYPIVATDIGKLKYSVLVEVMNRFPERVYTVNVYLSCKGQPQT